MFSLGLLLVIAVSCAESQKAARPVPNLEPALPSQSVLTQNYAIVSKPISETVASINSSGGNSYSTNELLTATVNEAINAESSQMAVPSNENNQTPVATSTTGAAEIPSENSDTGSTGAKLSALQSPLIAFEAPNAISINHYLTQSITVTHRNTLTLPTELSAKVGLEPAAESIVEEKTDASLTEASASTDMLIDSELITQSLPISNEQFIPVTLIPAAPEASNSSSELQGNNDNAEDDAIADGAIEEIRVERTARVPILMYHYLSVPPVDADIYRLDLSVTPEQFAQHLDGMLAGGYTTISLYDLWNHLYEDAALPPNPVILTFDDGYLDNYENAFPLLLERGMTATFFIVTDFAEQNRFGYMSWEMIRELYAAGMSVESHGINHHSLQNRDTEYLVFQALRTKELIEARVGTVPRFISYPAGQYDQNTVDVFASADYLLGVTTIQGSTHSTENPFELRRVRVRGTTTTDELLRLLALDW